MEILIQFVRSHEMSSKISLVQENQSRYHRSDRNHGIDALSLSLHKYFKLIIRFGRDYVAQGLIIVTNTALAVISKFSRDRDRYVTVTRFTLLALSRLARRFTADNSLSFLSPSATMRYKEEVIVRGCTRRLARNQIPILRDIGKHAYMYAYLSVGV